MNRTREGLEKSYIEDDIENIASNGNLSQRKYALSSNANSYRAHVYFTFIDPDFQSSVEALRQGIEKLYYPRISLRTSKYDPHLLQEDRLLIKTLADRFCISLDDLAFYADGDFSSGYIGFGKIFSDEGGFKFISPHEYEWRPVYVIGRDTSIEDVKSEWPYIKEMAKMHYDRGIKQKARKRSCLYPGLVYAVFKSRLGGLSFSKIYSLYTTNKLPLFSGSSGVFNSDESLERYYRKYAPAIPNPYFNSVVLDEHERTAYHELFNKLP